MSLCVAVPWVVIVDLRKMHLAVDRMFLIYIHTHINDSQLYGETMYNFLRSFITMFFNCAAGAVDRQWLDGRAMTRATGPRVMHLLFPLFELNCLQLCAGSVMTTLS